MDKFSAAVFLRRDYSTPETLFINLSIYVVLLLSILEYALIGVIRKRRRKKKDGIFHCVVKK